MNEIRIDKGINDKIQKFITLYHVFQGLYPNN